nr:hypothetical protein [Tanacetum cinerariifolium]
MAISVISVSSDSSEDIMKTPDGRIILFGTIPTTIPDTTPVIAPPTTQTDTIGIPTETPIIAPTISPSPDYTPASPDYSPASEIESDLHEDPSSCHIPPLPASDHSSPDLPSTSARPSHKRRSSPMTSVPALLPVIKALYPIRVDLIPSPKRVRDIGYLADVDVGPRETRVERVTHPTMLEDIPEPAQEGAVETIEGVQREQRHRIIGVESAVVALTERVAELERDNRRLRGTTSVESQRVDRLQRGMSPEEIEAREPARNLETLNENEKEQEGKNGGNENGENGQNGNGVNEGNEKGGNGGNGNGGNGENGNRGMNYGCFMPMAREYTFQDFLKCKPHTFSGTEGVVGLTRWFKKMETVFNISKCPTKYQVKYATCTLQNSALNWWNSHKRTIGGNDLTAYTQRFQELILLCTKMVPDEDDKVERFIGGLPDNIQGNVIAANPGSPTFDYVYYPSTNLFNRLPQPEYSHDDLHLDVTVVLRISFDPTKSLDYKVVQLFARTNMTLKFMFTLLRQAIRARVGTESEDKQLALYKFNIDDHDHPIITTIEIPNGLNQGRNFLQSYGGRECSYDPMIEQADIPGILHMQGRLFESNGCLLLVCRDVINSREFTIYEMVKGVMCGRLDDDDDDDDDDDKDEDEFIPPFEVDLNIYEFISSLASV